MSDFLDDSRRRGRRDRPVREGREEDWRTPYYDERRSAEHRVRGFDPEEDEMRWGDWDLRSDPWGEMRQERDWDMDRDPDGLRRGRYSGGPRSRGSSGGQRWQSQMSRVYGPEGDEPVEREDWDREMRDRDYGPRGGYGGGEFDRGFGREYGEDYGGFVGRPSEAEWRESRRFRSPEYRGPEYRGPGYRGPEYRGREFRGPGYRRRESGGPEAWGLEDERSRPRGGSQVRPSEYREDEQRSYRSGPGGYGLSRGNYGYNRGFSYPDREPQSFAPGQGMGARWEDLGQSSREQETSRWAGGDTDWDYGSTRSRRSGENWDIPGPYAGIGPKGYQRTDDRICEDVCERLTQHGRLDATGIEVEVEQGEVRLKGTVANRQAKRLAEEIAERAGGVQDIDNQLQIQQSEQDDTTRRGSRMGSGQTGEGFRSEYEGGSRSGQAELGRPRPGLSETGTPNLAGARTSEANLGGAQPGGASIASTGGESRSTQSGMAAGEIVPRTQPHGLAQVFPYPERSARSTTASVETAPSSATPSSATQSSGATPSSAATQSSGATPSSGFAPNRSESDLSEIWNQEMAASTQTLGDTQEAVPTRRETEDLGDTQPSMASSFRDPQSRETWGGVQSSETQEIEQMQRAEEDASGVWRVTMPSDTEIAGESGTIDAVQIKEGMQVVGSDGRPVGQVKELRQSDLLVDRPLARDIYVPYSACETQQGQVRLTVPAAEVDEQGWPKPDLFGGG